MNPSRSESRSQEGVEGMTEQRTELGVRLFNADSWIVYADDSHDVDAWAKNIRASGRTPIRRTVTYGPVEVVPEPLVFPTTPGSVILARTNANTPRVFSLGDDGRWTLMEGAMRGASWEPCHLTLIAVNYDAAKDEGGTE